MTIPSKRFQLVSPSGHNNELGQYGLMIEDFAWWLDNERNIFNWMVDTLPQGIDHLQGMFLYFPEEKDRVGFLLRWS